MKAKYKIWDSQKKQFISSATSKYSFLLMDEDGDMVEVGVKESELAYDYRKHLEPVFFTGLKDKNGIEIYEGDKLKTFRGSIYKCLYREETGCFEFENELNGSYSLFNQLIEPEIIS